MDKFFNGLEPQNVLRNFYELSGVTCRRADNTQGVSDYFVEFARRLGLEYYQDETTNVIIYKKATAGYENAPTVMLAGHMDMICATAPGVVHDFENEPLDVYLDDDGDTVRARGTTLGADCGLGLAFIMSVLESDDIPHPAIEAVFTTNEETDMKGAMQLHYDRLKSTVILSSDATRLSMGGAGELDMEIYLDRCMTDARSGDIFAEISIGGLIGGHSGKNAYAERGNANTLLVRVLSALQKKFNFRIASFVGGDTTACAYARDASCVIAFSKECRDCAEDTVREWARILRNELAVPDPDVQLNISFRENTTRTCDDDTTSRFIDIMTVLPDGLCSLHKYFDHKYESCVNVGVVEMTDTAFRVLVCIRFALASKKYFLMDKVMRVCRLLGATCNTLNDLPQWEYKNASRIEQIVAPIYSDLAPNVAQGTCEQGIFLKNMPDAEAAGIGPVVESPHSPNEHFSIKAMADDYAKFLKVLEAMKDY